MLKLHDATKPSRLEMVTRQCERLLDRIERELPSLVGAERAEAIEARRLLAPVARLVRQALSSPTARQRRQAEDAAIALIQTLGV